MTYLAFIACFVLPPVLIGVLAVVRARSELPRGYVASTLALICVALVYTIPWDRHLILTGVWGYPPDRVIATLWSIPVEELSFIVLQTLGVAAWTVLLVRGQALQLPARTSAGDASSGEKVRWLGIGITLQVSLFGFLLLQVDQARYLGLLLAWAGPILLLQLAYGGHYLWANRRTWLFATLPPVLYLWLIDRFAIGLGIWHFSPELTTGILLLGLPLEEALFFLLTSLMVNQGILLYLATVRAWEARAARPPRLLCWLVPQIKRT
jgi:lycopene cyclase domain-containing protein